jgi:hypothetical protein
MWPARGRTHDPVTQPVQLFGYRSMPRLLQVIEDSRNWGAEALIVYYELIVQASSSPARKT